MKKKKRVGEIGSRKGHGGGTVGTELASTSSVSHILALLINHCLVAREEYLPFLFAFFL